MPGWKYAFSLSREAVRAATPPGTVLLIDHGATQEHGKYVDRVIRYPEPSPDPADPLNWPAWRKAACMTVVSLYAFVANFTSTCISPALPIWNLSFPHDARPIQELMQFVALNVLVLGLGNIFWVPLANIFGRRPVLVLSTLILFVATACGTALAGFNTVLIIRILQGIGSSASETVVPALVGDMFFVHERGSWMAFYTAFLASGSVIGGIAGGYIAHRLGWFQAFWVGAVISGVAWLCTVFLVPETSFDRGEQPLPFERNLPRPSRFGFRTPPPRLSIITLPSVRLTLPSAFHWSGDRGGGLLGTNFTWYQTSSSIDITEMTSPPPPARFSVSTAVESSQYPPFTFARSLKFGVYRGHVLFQFMKPWLTLRLPATWIVMLQYGGLVAAVAVISTVGPQILEDPPYRWGEHTGLLFIGALVGILLGGFCTGMMADGRLKKLASNEDHGYAEPEARLSVMFPALLIGTCGILLFGFCAQYPAKYRWIGLEFAYGMAAFALTQIPSVWFNYVASDCFVMICILRGLIPFAWTFFVDQWVQRDGYLIPFGGFTAIMGAFSLLVLPVMWMGKRMRIATARYVVDNQ
ncbi:hypothetical protein VTK56DRAFT_2284 [Thermocarpiscus australiensis]